jgi:hypothetical protein
MAMSSQWLKHWFPHLPGALDRAPMAGLMCAGALLLGVALAGARSSLSGDNKAAPSTEPAANRPAAVQFHEGEEIVDRMGKFIMAGERAVFITNEHQRFIGLENQTLQYVVKTLQENPGQLRWVVSGTVTEYCGANYLLFTRAQLVTADSKQ